MSVLLCNDDDDEEEIHVRAHRGVVYTERPPHIIEPICQSSRGPASLFTVSFDLSTASKPIDTTSDIIITAMSESYLPKKKTGATFASAMLNAPQMHISPDAFIEPGASRRTSRKSDNGLYDPNKPVLLHEDIVDGEVSADEVLLEFGFALCDADADIWLYVTGLG